MLYNIPCIEIVFVFVKKLASIVVVLSHLCNHDSPIRTAKINCFGEKIKVLTGNAKGDNHNKIQFPCSVRYDFTFTIKLSLAIVRLWNLFYCFKQMSYINLFLLML